MCYTCERLFIAVSVITISSSTYGVNCSRCVVERERSFFYLEKTQSPEKSESLDVTRPDRRIVLIRR